MAKRTERLAENAEGDFFVDSSCIDCATCRQIAPASFTEGANYSYVHRQPADAGEQLRALMALVACPTHSIGTLSKADIDPGVRAFPERIDENVYFCGFTSEDSFGAWSYLIRRPEGNLLIDSPRAAGPLMKRLKSLGGIESLFLTHRDDVADHEIFHREFGCKRILHRSDITAETADIEQPLTGLEPFELADDLLIIPVPGHTPGHTVLLYRNRFLFTGDHLAWSPQRKQLYAFRDACWYSWREQIRSMERLLDHSFEWVLPGHGRRFQAVSAEAMKAELVRCISWMRRV
jgi:glyoxylase-like metal-dependent hydrolase (beta-lactamase superfamily II)/ferredoxin